MAEFDDRKKASSSGHWSSDHDVAPVQRRVDLLVPTPAPPAPATPQERLAFMHVQRGHQAAAVAPVVQASATLQRLRAEIVPERLSLQRQIDAVQSSLPAGAEQAALHRQAERVQPPQVPLAFQRRPSGQGSGVAAQIGDWAGLYAHEMRRQQADQQGMYASAPVTHLQRQVAAGLAQSVRRSALPPLQRYAEVGQALATIGRQPLGASTVRGCLNTLLPAERPAIQRALDEANLILQRQEEQDAQVQQLHSLQRQLEAHRAQSDQAQLMQRIKARQGSGDPLPASV